MQLTKYKLGDLIVQRREKNKGYDLPIRGVSREGFIKPKVEEADTSIYNVFYMNDFVFNPARMELNSIALNLDLDKALCSSLYEVFYVKDENVVLPEFLNLHIKRDEFARHCDYIGLGSAREYCRFANIADFDIKIPPIEVQREIVQADRQIKRRMRLNEQMIKKLEATAQALYRKTFVDNIDKENLPEGWNFSTLGEVFDITIGRTPPRAEEKWFRRETDKENNFPWVSIADMNNGMYVLDTRERLTKEAVDWFKIPIVPPQSVLLSFKMTVGRVCITTETTLSNEAIAHFVFKDNTQIREYLYMFLKNIDYKTIGSTSSITEAINTNMIKTMLIIMPSNDVTQKFHEQLLPVFSAIYLKQKENEKLTELQSLLLAKMGQ